MPRKEDTFEEVLNQVKGENQEVTQEEVKVPIIIPGELVKAYQSGLERDVNMQKDVVLKSYQFTLARREVEKFNEVLEQIEKEIDRINEERENIDKALKEVQRQMEDSCKLDRNKNWQLRLDEGIFVEVEG